MILNGYKLGTILLTAPTDSNSLAELKAAMLKNSRPPYQTDNEKLTALFDTLQVDVRNHIQEKVEDS